MYNYIVKIKVYEDLIKSDIVATYEEAQKIKEEFNDKYQELSFYGAYIEEVLDIKFI